MNEQDAPQRMRKLSRAMMPAWKVRQLKVEQAGLCLLCGKPIDLSIEREGAVDHNHTTGEIRGVLHRSCNAAEGKVRNAIGSWGTKSFNDQAILEFAAKLVVYWHTAGCGLIYPTHVDAETSKRKAMDKRNVAAKERRASIKARKLVRDNRAE